MNIFSISPVTDIRPISYFPLQSHKHELNCGNGQRRERWPTESNFRRGQSALVFAGITSGANILNGNVQECRTLSASPSKASSRPQLHFMLAPPRRRGSGNQCFGNAFLRARSPMWMDGWLWEIVNVETASEKSDIGKRVRVILLNFA